MRLDEHRAGTHRVTNQPPLLMDYDLFAADVVLAEAVVREGGAWGVDRLHELGTTLGGEPLRLGAIADRNPPVLRTHDRYGNRIDEIDFHPAWTKLLDLGIRRGSPRCPGGSPGREPTWFGARRSFCSRRPKPASAVPCR